MSYLLLIVVTLAIGFGAQAYVNRQIKKYSYVPISNGMTVWEIMAIISLIQKTIPLL